MNTTDTGLSMHQCVYCGASRDDEIDALLCGPCATMLATRPAGLPAFAVTAESSKTEVAAQLVLVGSR